MHCKRRGMRRPRSGTYCRIWPRRCASAFSSMAWNTGSRSPGELLMTCSTSEVAVCCCSDSRSSLSSRVFSMAMTAWSAKFSTSSICLSVNGRTSWR